VVADEDYSCSSKASNISLSSSETFSFLTLSSAVLILQFSQRFPALMCFAWFHHHHHVG
jgi:hypothetical protein